MAKALSCFLVTISDETSTDRKIIDARVCSIGRALDSTLSFAHPEVSRIHCIISFKHDKLWIEDQDSSNGTFVDGEKIAGKRQVQISSDSRIKLGKSQIILSFEVFEKVYDEDFAKRLKLPEEERETLLEVVRAAQAEAGKLVKAGQDQHDRLLKSAEQKANGIEQQSLLKQDEIIRTANVNANKMIQDAKQEAAKVVLQSEEDAEKAVQNVYAKAEAFRAQAEQYYQSKIKESEAKGDEIIKKDQDTGQNILQEARSKAQTIRDSVLQESETIVKLAKERAESEKSEIFAKVKREAEEAARLEVMNSCAEMLKKAESDAMEIIQKASKQETQIRSGVHDSEILLGQLQKQAEEKQESIADLDRKLKKLADDRDSLYVEVNTLQAEHQEVTKEIKSGFEKIETIKDETRAKEEKLGYVQDQIRVHQENQGKLALDIEERKRNLELLKSQLEDETQGMRTKLEIELEKVKKEHAEEMDKIKFQDIEIAKKLKQEYVDELYQEKDKLTKDILDRLELKMINFMPSSSWNNLEIEVAKDILQMIEKRTMSISTSANEAKAAVSVGDPKKRRQQASLSMFVVGITLGVGLVFMYREFENKYIKRDIAAEDAKAATIAHDADLERRKFNPEQNYVVRDTYVDSVLYTKDFAKVFLNNSFQISWTKAATAYLLENWRLEEEVSIQLVSLSAALVEALEEKHKQIHPDRIDASIKKMQELEEQELEKMKKLLLTNVKFEAYKSFEKKFITNELAKKIPTSD